MSASSGSSAATSAQTSSAAGTSPEGDETATSASSSRWKCRAMRLPPAVTQSASSVISGASTAARLGFAFGSASQGQLGDVALDVLGDRPPNPRLRLGVGHPEAAEQHLLIVQRQAGDLPAHREALEQ